MRSLMFNVWFFFSACNPLSMKSHVEPQLQIGGRQSWGEGRGTKSSPPVPWQRTPLSLCEMLKESEVPCPVKGSMALSH